MDGADRRILILGDSYVAGVGDPEGLGWVGRVVARAAVAGTPVTAYPLGIRRDTSADVARRWETEWHARRAPGAAMGVVLAFGANDAVLEDGRPRIPPEQTVAAVRDIAAALRAAGAGVLVVGPPPLPSQPGHAGRALALEDEFAGVCGALGLACIRVTAALARSRPWREEALRGDGAHPAGRGYAELAELMTSGGLVSWLDGLAPLPGSG